MQDICKFIQSNAVMLIILVNVFLSIGLFVMLNWQRFKAEMYKLMLQAKRLAKDEILKSGDEQVEWIIMATYFILPKAWTVFLPEYRLRVIIKFLYNKLKDSFEGSKIKI